MGQGQEVKTRTEPQVEIQVFWMNLLSLSVYTIIYIYMGT